MSISSDIFISREEAVEQVTKMMMHNQEELVKKAVSAMDSWELAHYLNSGDGSGLYFYNVEDDHEDDGTEEEE